MTDIAHPCPLAPALAARMREAREELTRRWLDRIAERVELDPNRIFPTDALLDHVPLLIDGVADYLADPAHEIAADMPVVAKAMELGELRHAQGFDEYELLKEYELLGGILFSFLTRCVDEIDAPCSRGELLVCAHRIFHALSLIEQATVTHYLRLMKGRLREREQRLRGFNRALTHELKNQIGAAMGALEVVRIDELPDAQRGAMLDIAARNVASMRGVLDNLLELSRLDAAAEGRQERRILLPRAVSEAVRELRQSARAAGVEIRIAALPEVEVSAAATELAVSNYVSNAIKYADRAKPRRWVEVRGTLSDESEGGQELVIEVRDNGLGVPEEQRARLFEQFFRAHETITGVEGTGLGLSIVRDAVEPLGGRAWAEFPEEGGSAFFIAFPSRRTGEHTADDAPAAGAGADRVAHAAG
jgi:signal transduction histidine kinase